MAVRPLGGPFYSPDCPKWPFSGQKCCFSAGNSFFRDIIQKSCSHCDRTPKRQQFCVDSLHGGPLGGGRVHFWPKIDPKNCLFSCYTLKHPFLVLRRTTLYGIIASPYPEATLISFSFPIWDHFGPNMADNWFAD